MKPIPRSLLIHSATLQTATIDDYQSKTYTTVATLTCIRVEPTTKQVLGSDNLQKQLSAVLIFDARNSRPANTTFLVGQYVSFSGNRYRVEVVDSLYDARKLHHYEVGLSG